MRSSRRSLHLPACVAAWLCACNPYYECAPVESRHIDQLPARLSETGLYRGEELAERVWPYHPRFGLWSDGAEKRRFIHLPEGARIDTSNADDWRFPQGTKLWKEFTRDGVRVETRLIYKFGPGGSDWSTMSYLWRPDGSDADALPNGAIDAAGTEHNVPAAGECWACHGPRESFVLGFSYLQLAYDADAEQLDVARLDELDLLTSPLEPERSLPGDPTAQRALGYLHANCGHCHNQTRAERGGPRCFDPENKLDLWLHSDQLARVEDTVSYRSAVGHWIRAGQPDKSKVVKLMSRRDGLSLQMPPLATEDVDRAGVADVRAFIEALR